jgi:hypothetical protein
VIFSLISSYSIFYSQTVNGAITEANTTTIRSSQELDTIIGYDNLFIYCSIDIINQEKMLHYKMINIILLLLISLRDFTLIVDAIFFSLCLYLRA